MSKFYFYAGITFAGIVIAGAVVLCGLASL